ncbi:MAG: Na(+)-translocating NADH-quinone reductase subunit A [Vicinamibacteria bacterium]
MIEIRRGLDLPITGGADETLRDSKPPGTVALLGGDYIGMKPTMAVKVADDVKLGQLLFTDKTTPGVRYTAPGSGRVLAIHRGERRALLSVVIQLRGNDQVTFESHSASTLAAISREQVVELLVDSGLWAALRTRPFSRVPSPETTPHSLFVTAMDTNPLAPSAERILEGQEEDFRHGLRVVSKLTDGKTYLCKAPHARVPEVDLPGLVLEEFAGPHPSGLPGTHIHFLDPVNRAKTVWHIGLQDVIAVGKLFTTGTLQTDRMVSLAGPAVKGARLIRTRLGASLDDLTAGELTEGENRIVSGSVLSGTEARDATAFLGRYHQQVSVLPEYRKREFLGWLSPGLEIHSLKNIVLSSFLPGKRFDLTTTANGEVRMIIPNGSYEKVMPLDIMPLHLLRALAVDDVEEAESLGCLELDEEDLALCAYVCPSKLEFGPILRRNLTRLEREG